MTCRLALFAALLAAATTVPALAQGPAIVRNVTPDDLVALLKTNGVQAAVPATPTHRPAVQALLGGQRGMVFLFDCRETRCGSIKFVAVLDATPERDLAFLNTWNSRRRYVSAYLHEGSVFLVNDFDLRPGVTSAAISSQVRLFEFLVKDFLGFKP